MSTATVSIDPGLAWKYGQCIHCGHGHVIKNGRRILTKEKSFWRVLDEDKRKCYCGCENEERLVLDVRKIERDKQEWRALRS